MKGVLKPNCCLFIVALLLSGGLTTVYGQGRKSLSNKELSINLKSQALVLGPVIRLGDIGILSVPDSVARRRLESVELGKAAPPGESREISIYYIRRSLKRAGLGKFISNIKGPKTIRVTTAPIELDKARLRDGIAKVIISNRLTKKT